MGHCSHRPCPRRPPPWRSHSLLFGSPPCSWTTAPTASRRCRGVEKCGWFWPVETFAFPSSSPARLLLRLRSLGFRCSWPAALLVSWSVSFGCLWWSFWFDDLWIGFCFYLWLGLKSFDFWSEISQSSDFWLLGFWLSVPILGSWWKLMAPVCLDHLIRIQLQALIFSKNSLLSIQRWLNDFI